MSFCLRPNVCKKCGKPLTLFEGWTCLECEKAEQEPILDKIRAELSEDYESYSASEVNFEFACGIKRAIDTIDYHINHKAESEE